MGYDFKWDDYYLGDAFFSLMLSLTFLHRSHWAAAMFFFACSEKVRPRKALEWRCFLSSVRFLPVWAFAIFSACCFVFGFPLVDLLIFSFFSSDKTFPLADSDIFRRISGVYTKYLRDFPIFSLCVFVKICPDNLSPPSVWL